MKKHAFAVMFMCLVMGCGVESRSADGRAGAAHTEQVSTTEAQLTGPAEQICLEGCLLDCGAVCPLGSGKAECIHECGIENQECRDFCANQ